MADQANIFNEDKAATQTPDGTKKPDDEINNILSNIKNEQGQAKYKTVSEALKALQHAQEFIPTLKANKSELEAQLEEAKKKAEKVTELEATVQELIQKINSASSATPAEKTLNPEAITEIVKKTLSASEQEKVAKQNINTVTKTVKEVFRDKAEELFYGKAEEAGFSRAEINELASRNPNAVFKLLEIKPATSSSPFKGDVNTTGMPRKTESFMKPNVSKSVLLGASSSELATEASNARALVDELHSQGKSVYDLTDPKVYFKIFQ